jgi:hypothetical protein
MNTIGTALIVGLAAVFAFSLPATSSAAPREWDIEAFDKCIEKAGDDYINDRISAEVYQERVRNCCPDSGGISIAGAPAAIACRAPGYKSGSDVVLPGAPVQTFQPAPPPLRDPGSVTQTLAPAGPG